MMANRVAPEYRVIEIIGKAVDAFEVEFNKLNNDTKVRLFGEMFSGDDEMSKAARKQFVAGFYAKHFPNMPAVMQVARMNPSVKAVSNVWKDDTNEETVLTVREMDGTISWERWSGTRKMIVASMMTAVDYAYTGAHSSSKQTDWKRLRAYAVPAAAVGTMAGLAKKAYDDYRDD